MFSFEKVISEIIPLWLKNQDQRVDRGGEGGGLMRGEDYTRGAYTWSNTCVKENVSLFVEGPIHGKLIGREVWYFFVAMVPKASKGMTFIH